ncbi:MAG: primosomal protein N' [Bacteroidales bacterium]
MDYKTRFVDVILPLPVSGTFTYRLQRKHNEAIAIGKRVVVQFGRKKIYTAIVAKVHEKVPDAYDVKYILDILDDAPVIRGYQLQLWYWMSDYYMCELGEVSNAALPGGLKLASETRIALNRNAAPEPEFMNHKERTIIEALTCQGPLTIAEISNILNQKKVMHLVRNLIERSLVITQEQVKEKYSPKIETYVRLSKEYEDGEKMKQALDALEKRAYKQLQMLLSFINLSRNTQDAERKEIKKSTLIKSAGGSHAQFNSLVDKGILSTYEKAENRIPVQKAIRKPSDIVLTAPQKETLHGIHAAFDQKDVILLHGVTSSGKTEIYIKLIEEMIRSGKQVLYLLPEIALTTQVIRRLTKYFGSSAGVYHSRFNQMERVEIWGQMLREENPLPLVLGARSALFLPFSNLGLVIIDEEHDTSYKQYDPAPRYNARDTAIYLARLFGAKTLMGTATPSFESYYNGLTGKYGLVRLQERYGNIELPKIRIVDLRKDHMTSKKRSHFSSVLLNEIERSLKDDKQVILFQNRRGFSLRLECSHCGHIPMCVHCDISLTYHKYQNHLRCHYCGYHSPVPSRCPECGSKEIFMKGFGTEKIEDELNSFFPRARIRRMDLDTTRSRYSYQQIISDFESRRIDILVGTQMITKGLDFNDVDLVGIMNADNMLTFPDFRAFERSVQLMLQVSGRAGRKHRRGNVFIQTYHPEHPVFKDVLNHDYVSFYHAHITERETFKYPPFYRLISLKVRHRDQDVMNRAADALGSGLKKTFGKRVLGPEYPLVTRIKNQYIKQILIKLEKSASVTFSRNAILECVNDLMETQEYKRIQIQIDADPL